MAAKVSLFLHPAISSSTFLPCRELPSLPAPSFHQLCRRTKSTKVLVQLGGGKGDAKKAADQKKFITREEEPEQYWQTAGEREGENPMKTPLPYIIIFGMSTPFIILAVAFANGWIKVPVR